MKCYLDFDGTVVEHYYPLIGAYNPGVIEVLYLLQAKGYELILNTYRSEIDDNSLNEALHYINQLPLFKKITQTTTYKISPMQWDVFQAIESNQLYIDDIAPDMPLINAPKSGGKMVVWRMVYRDLVLEKKSKYEFVSPLSNFGIGTTDVEAFYEHVSNKLNIFWGAIVFGGYQFLKGYLC